MRRILALFTLSALLLPGQENDPLPGPLPPPELPVPLPPPPSPEDEPHPLAGIIDGTAGAGFAMPDKFKVTGDDIKPRFDNRTGEGIITIDGRLKVSGENGMQAFADHVTLRQKDKSARLTGDVIVYLSGLVYRGESADYFYEEDRIDTSKMRIGAFPLVMEAGRFRNITHEGQQVLIGEDSGITTHDVEHPDFWLRADKISVFPGDKVIFQDMRLKAGDRSLLWLPYLAQPLDADLGFRVIPGGRSNLGAFLKTAYGSMLGGDLDPVTGEKENAWILSKWHADLYTLRGLGIGTDFFDTRVDPTDQFGWLKFYYIHDFNSSQERAGVNRGEVTNERYRVELAHRFFLGSLVAGELANYSLDADLTFLSDQHYLEDFDPSEFSINRAPDNYLALTRRTANSLSTLNTRLRLNTFYQTDTRLPEITHDWIRQPLLESRVLYENKSSLGFYEEHLDDFRRESLRDEAGRLRPGSPRIAEIDLLLEDRGFARFNTYHEASLPLKAGHFNIVPRAGGGFTSYNSVQGSSDSLNRTSVFAGVDVSTKFTKDYPDLVNARWGLDGVRHIVQPYATLSHLSTNDLDPTFGRIDRLTATTRPRTLRIGRFAGIDDLSDWSILRTGVRNRILTQRDSETHEWLALDTYFDSFFDDPEFTREFSNLYNDMHWRPLQWLDLELETQFPLFNDSNFTEVAAAVRFMPTDSLELRAGYRHLNAHPILRNSNQLVLESFARLNEYWGIGTYHRYEPEDGVLEVQQYNIHHDFDSFVGSVGVFQRNNRSDDEYGIMFSFGLKEIPSLSLPIEIGAE